MTMITIQSLIYLSHNEKTEVKIPRFSSNFPVIKKKKKTIKRITENIYNKLTFVKEVFYCVL